MGPIKYLRVRSREKRNRKIREEQEEEEKKAKLENYKRDLEKLRKRAEKYILTISESIYIESQGKKLSDYEFESVITRDKSRYEDIYNLAIGFLEQMVLKGEEIGAEIIVNLRPLKNESSEYCEMIATALIPKKAEKKNNQNNQD